MKRRACAAVVVERSPYRRGDSAARLFAVALAFVVAAAFGEEWKWNYPAGGGTSWTDTADWNDPANWLGGGTTVPNGTGAIASFTNDCNGTKYVRLPESGVTVDALALKNSSYVNITGGKLTTRSIANSKNNNFYFFCDVDFALDSSHKADRSGYTCQNFAGRVSMPQTGSPENNNNNWTCGSHENIPRHRLDWGATSEDWSENIVNPCPTNGMQSGTQGGKYIYAPRGTDAPITLSGCTLTSGSKMVTLASDAKARSTLPVGTRVTGDGIPPDTYLRFIYSNTLIELTKAYDGEDTSAGSLTFAAFTPHVYQDMLWFDCWDGGPQRLYIGKYRTNDVFRLTLHTLRSQGGGTADAKSLRLSVPASGMVPATLVLKNTANLKSRFIFQNGHVEFHPDGSKGFNATCRTTFEDSLSTGRVTCVEGVDAKIGCLTNWIGTLIKDGPATLTVGVRSISNSKLVLEEGKVVWTNTVPADVGPESQSLASLKVSEDAVFSLAEGCSLSVGSAAFARGMLEVASGATLSVTGSTPIEPAGIAGGGTVAGNVDLAPGAVVRARVNASGEIAQVLAVTGNVNLTRGGTIVLEGDVSRLQAGTWPLVTSPLITSGSAAGWTCAANPRYTIRAVAHDGAFVLNVVPKGIMIEFK